MIETKDKEIGEVVYRVKQFGAKRGRQVLFRVSQMLGPTLAQATEGDYAAAFKAFAETAKLEDFEWLCDTFADGTSVVLKTTNGNEVPQSLAKVYDEHFVGRYLEMLEWLVFAFEVNFGGFLEQMGLVALRKNQQAPKPSPPQ